MFSASFVKETALSVGFDACGIAVASPISPDEWPYDTWIDHGYQAGMDYMSQHRNLRFDPTQLFPGTRSVISVLLGYKPDTQIPHIAQYAYGEDYHERIKRMLYTLISKLQKVCPGLSARPFVDTAPIPDKLWAVRAGLGWVGRNTLLVNPQLGSYCNIGEILTDAVFDHYDSPIPNGCPPDCHRCVNACPNKALVPLTNPPATSLYSHILNASLCTAYNTIENHDAELPESLNTTGYAFGCDRCQLSCPYNQTAPISLQLTPERRAQLESLSQLPEDSLSQFKKFTRHSAMSRIKYSQWLRNLRKALPLLVLGLFLSPSGFLHAQSYAERFEAALTQGNGSLQRQILTEWQQADSNDVEYYVALYNYYTHRPGQEEHQTPNVKDSALIALNTAIGRFPNRLDLRFGKAYYLSSTGRWDDFADELVRTASYSQTISHRWDYPNLGNNIDPEIGEQLVTDGLLDYLTDIYTLATSPTIDTAMVLLLRRVSLRMAQVFPSNVPALNFLATSFSLLGDYDRALKYLQRAQRIDPNDEVVRQNISKLQKHKL